MRSNGIYMLFGSAVAFWGLLCQPASGQRQVFWTQTNPGGEDHIPGDGSIWRTTLSGSNAQPFLGAVEQPMGIAAERDVVYWTQGVPSDIYRRRINGGTSERIYRATGSWRFARELALDVADRKLYWVQFNNSTTPGAYWIRRANVDGTEVENLLAIIDADNTCCEVYGLAVASTLDKMCWGRESTGTVECARLDGSDRQVVVSGLSGLVTFAGIDEQAGYLYWFSDAPSGSSFRRSDLDGQNQVILYFSLNWPTGAAIDVSTGYMYWISTFLRRARLDGGGIEFLGPATPNPGRVVVEALPAGIPAASEWGLAAMVLLVLIAGTAILRKRVSGMTKA